MFEKIKNLENKIPIGIISLILSILFFIVSSFYFNETKIQYRIINDSNLYSLHKPLESLKIMFNNEDINEKKLNLKILKIKVINTGNRDIIKDQFDNNLVWGVKFDNAKIVDKIKLIETSNSYLNKNIKIKNDFHTVEFNKLMFDVDSYFIIEVLLLHDLNIEPKLVALGKISGSKEIEIINDTENDEFYGIFSGGILLNIIRFFLYIFVFIILISLLTLFMSNSYPKYDKKHLEKIKKQKLEIKKRFEREINEEELDRFSSFFEPHKISIDELYNFLHNIYKKNNDNDIINQITLENKLSKLREKNGWNTFLSYNVEELLKKGIIEFKNNKYKIKKENFLKIKKIYNFLKNKNENNTLL